MAPDLNWELRLGFLVHDVSRLRRRVVDRALKPLGVTRSQWWVLAFLSRSDGMSQVALADELDLGKVALGPVDRPTGEDGVRLAPARRGRPSGQAHIPHQAQPRPDRADPGQCQRDREGNPRKNRRGGLEGDRPRASGHERKPAYNDRRQRRRRGFGRAPDRGARFEGVAQRNPTSPRSSTRTERSRARARNRRPSGVLNNLDPDRVAGEGRRGEARRHGGDLSRPARRE